MDAALPVSVQESIPPKAPSRSIHLLYVPTLCCNLSCSYCYCYCYLGKQTTAA